MTRRSAQFVAEATGAEVLAGQPSRFWQGMDFDSRRLRGGELFVALPGEQADGHDFVPSAIDAGVSAVLVSKDVRRPRDADSDVVWLRVDDTYSALHALTRAVRREVPEHLVAITGSAGKTTTKELLSAMLATRFRVAKSPGNFNNLYGFPLALLNIDDDSQWMVAEMGMSTPGELQQVSRLGRPDVAVFTNVKPVHLQNFSSLRGIAEAKAELLAGLAEGGVMVANADDPEVMHIAQHHLPSGAKVVTYGFEQPADVQGRRLRPLGDDRPGSRFDLLLDDGSEFAVELPIHGLYNAENCLAAAAACLSMGVEGAEIVRAMAALKPARMRGEVHRLDNDVLLIDDSYNSNPAAAVKALESARLLRAGRYLAVLGDMLELGPREAEFHQQVGQRAAELGFEVLAVGPLGESMVQGARQAGGRAHGVVDAAAAATWLRRALAQGGLTGGDLVLIKGSRGIGLETATEALRTAGVAAAEETT